MNADCVPSGCQCPCHTPGMGVAHLVACCDQPPAPIERFGLKLTAEDFAALKERLDRIAAAEKAAWKQLHEAWYDLIHDATWEGDQ